MSFEDTTFQRCPHDKENPYAQISRDLIRDKTISFQTRGFLIYCLSFTGKWNISMPYFMKEQEIGKDRMYSMIKEAIDAGYMKRHDFLEGGLRRYKYFISETPKFKKCLLYPEKQDTEKQDTENPHTTKKQSSSSLHSEEETNKEHKEAPTSSPPSADASFLVDFFLKKIRERNPEFKEPNRGKWAQHFDRLLRIDKRDKEQIIQLILWASDHRWWKTACLSPEKLRKSYDEMSTQKLGDSEKELVRLNRTYALNLKDQHPEPLKALSFDDKYVMNRTAGKELRLNMEHEAFKDAFITMFGGSRG